MRAYFEEMLRGPGHLRFLIQPLVAIALGLRDGHHDRALGRRPYLLGLASREAGRGALLKEGLKAIVVPLGLAVTASIVFQFLTVGYLHPGAALGYALVFVALPYALSRALMNRALGAWRRRAA